MHRYHADFNEKGFEILDRITGDKETILTNDFSDERCNQIRERCDRKNAEWAKTKTIVDDLIQRLNVIGGDDRYDDIVMSVRNQHRTLQQNFTRLCVAWLDQLAKLEENDYDLRMEASVRLAKKLAKMEEWRDYKYLPTI